MTDRERFLATMHYQERDRVPMYDFGFWPETIAVWKEQGLPAEIHTGWGDHTTAEYFGMDSMGGGPGINVGLCPGFEEEVIEDRGDHELVRQGDGVIVLRKKFMGSIPEHHGHLLVDRDSWKQHYQWRLDPSRPERYPKDWETAVKVWSDPDRSFCCAISGGSLYGWIRNWMGVEQVSYVVYDDPAFFEEMVTTIGDCVVECVRRALDAGARFDFCAFWEDMCYNSGPLLNPLHFKKYLVPQYARITRLLRRHGCDIFWVDCDGKIDELIPLWLEAGVNCMFPVEVGTWRADPIRYRKQYGRQLLLEGGFDKHLLARSKREIEQEIHRLAPLVEEGGYIPFCDHRVPPDVPLENYWFYLETARPVWAKGVNLKPMGQPPGKS